MNYKKMVLKIKKKKQKETSNDFEWEKKQETSSGEQSTWLPSN